MAAELVLVADAITTELAAAQQGGQFVGLDEFTPERSYADWATDIEELPGLRVDVVPVGYEENALETRGTVEYVCTSDIAVRQWFPQSQRETNGRIKLPAIDRLIEFVQELNEFFCKENGRRLPAYPSAVWQKNNIRFTYSRKHLARHKLFVGMVRVGYTVCKSLT